MTQLSDSRYWLYAVTVGSLIQTALFGSLPFLGMNANVDEETDYIVVDFMEWQPPTAKPAALPAIQEPPKPVVKTKPEKPKQILEKAPSAEVKPDIPQPVLTTLPSESSETESPPKPLAGVAVPMQPNTNATTTEDAANTLPQPVPIFKLSAMPRYVHEAIGVYPPDMRALGLEAVVQLEILIDATGKIRKIEITKSAGRSFDEAALEKIRQSTFLPGHIDGKPVAVLLREKVRFDLR